MNQEASEGLGFSDCGLGKAYHAGRNRIGEYKLYTTLKEFAVSLFFFQNILERIFWGQVSQAQKSLGYRFAYPILVKFNHFLRLT